MNRSITAEYPADLVRALRGWARARGVSLSDVLRDLVRARIAAEKIPAGAARAESQDAASSPQEGS